MICCVITCYLRNFSFIVFLFAAFFKDQFQCNQLHLFKHDYMKYFSCKLQWGMKVLMINVVWISSSTWNTPAPAKRDGNTIEGRSVSEQNRCFNREILRYYHELSYFVYAFLRNKIKIQFMVNYHYPIPTKGSGMHIRPGHSDKRNKNQVAHITDYRPNII